MSIIKIKNINKNYTNEKGVTQKVLKNVSLDFDTVGLVAIIGKSGCGKSTLLNLISLIDRPTNGKIYFNNIDTSKWKHKEIDRYHNNDIGIIFQQYNLLEDQTVLYNVALPMLINGDKKKSSFEEAETLLSGIEFPKELWQQKVKDLSGGEKQRIAILRSVINSPKILVCDEPTGALDSNNSIKVMELLKKASVKRLVIIVSHNTNLIKTYADRIITLNDGTKESDVIINCRESIPITDKYKRKSNDQWSEEISKNNFIRRIRKNIISIVSLAFCIIICTLIVGFASGYKESMNVESKKHLDIGTSVICKEYKEDVSDGIISLVQQIRPSLNEIKQLEKDHPNFIFIPSYDVLLNSKSKIVFNDSEVKNISYSPIYSFSDNYVDGSLLIEGRLPRVDSFYEVVINRAAYNLIGNDVLNKEIVISSEYQNKINIIDNEYNQIIDYFSLNRILKVVGVVDELSFLSTPAIYYSYKSFDEYLESVYLDNYSDYLGYLYSWKERILYASDIEEISNYSYKLFAKDYHENLLELENFTITNNAYVISEALNQFLYAASIGLYLFLIISVLGAILVLGIISFSSYSEDRKRSAILSSIGAPTSKITEIYFGENLFIAIPAIISAFILAPPLILLTNFIIEKVTGLQNLLAIPNKVLINVSFSYYFLVIVLCLFVLILVTVLPIIFSKKISISEEFRCE